MVQLIYVPLGTPKKLLRRTMRPHDKWIFLLFGFVFWAIGTLWYEIRGPHIFETTSLRYWINFVLTPVISATACIALLKARHVPLPEWASAALLIALPGMFGEAVLLSRFAVFMPCMRPETGGKYGALLFASYGVFLVIAEIATLTARSTP